MVICSGIGPQWAKGQEGKLRAVAIVLEQPPYGKLAIVACDVCCLTRDLLDPVAAEIEETTGIPVSHVLINATHTHHAPSTITLDGYYRDQTFCRRVQRAIVKAVQEANAKLPAGGCQFYFGLGEEKTVGQNSRLLLSDNTIYWIGPRSDAVRPTGPFDSQLPVLAFKDPNGKLRALIYNHSTHTIGTVHGRVRSPSFYGLAAQELEQEWGGTICFLEGASGSTHNLDMPTDEAIRRIEKAIKDALAKAEEHPVTRLAAIKRPFFVRVRHFDEAQEDEAVSYYCLKRIQDNPYYIISIFRRGREIVRPDQGKVLETWLQAMVIGDVAIVGVPAELFTSLGLEIKRRSPFGRTYVAELANDTIGYLADEEAYDLGGYQVWTSSNNSYAERGTGERIVDEILAMLNELAAGMSAPTEKRIF